MPEPSAHAGLEPSPTPTDALFFAVYPDAQAAAHITRLRSKLIREHGLKGAPIAVPRLHVTLHYLGGFAGLPEQVVTQCSEAAASVARRSSCAAPTAPLRWWRFSAHWVLR
jgi:hypothetical protein